MTGMTGLERGYARLLACYPRAFRREHEQEILAVLMAGTREGQRRPGLAESADLIRSALLTWLRPPGPRPPRTVRAAVRLMYAGAAVELAALITIVVSTGAVRAAVFQRNPGFTVAEWHAVLINLTVDKVAASVVIALWLWMAWANSRGHHWARVVFAVFFGLTSLGLLSSLAQDAPVYATADLIAGIALWLVELAAIVLIFSTASAPYYRRSLPADGRRDPVATPGQPAT